MPHLRLRLACVLCFAFPALCASQEPLRSEFPAESAQLLNRLRAIDKLNVAATSPQAWWSAIGQIAGATHPFSALAGATPVLVDHNTMEMWEKLLDETTQLGQDADDSLVPLPAPALLWTRGTTSSTLARLCQRRLLDLPSVVLLPYRQRIGPEAKKEYETGRDLRASEPLRRLVDERYCSSYTGQALDLLGDLAFEKGRFDEAAHWWGQLAPLPSEEQRNLSAERRPACLNPRQAQAKRILALAFLGDLSRAQDELGHFQSLHPEAAGHLAGREGRYAQTLRDVFVDLAKAGPFTNQDDWTTFAGDGSRNRALMQCPPTRLWEDGPAWRVKLPALPGVGRDAAPLSRKLAYHPVIAKDLLLLPDAAGLTGYDLFTGKERFRYTWKAREKAGSFPRFTATVEGSRAYLRFGAQEIGPRVGEAAEDEASELVCVDFSDEKKPRVAWNAQPLPSPQPTFFEGAPLVVDGQVFAAQSRVVNRRTRTMLVSYDRNGRLRWKREVSDCPEFEERAAPRGQQHLLTWTGGQLVYCSHAGAVVAVEPWTGLPLWAVRYPRRKTTPAEEQSPREASPCVAWGGRIFVAPQDSDHLLCLDAATGRVVWDHEGAEVAHLLGVAGDRLVVATRRGLAALNATTGQPIWTQPSDGKLPSLGRGLLAGGWIFWPTQDRKLPLRGVTLAEGEQQKTARGQGFFAEPDFFDPTQLAPIPAGNMAFGQGCLAVAGTEEMVVFVPADKTPPPAMLSSPAAVLEQRYRALQAAAALGRRADAIAQALQLLDATKATAQAEVWRELLETRLVALVDRDLGDALLPTLPAKARAQVWKLRIDHAIASKQDEAITASRLAWANDRDAATAWLADRAGFPFQADADKPTPRAKRVEASKAPVAPVTLPYTLAWRHSADAWLPCARFAATADDDLVFTLEAGALVCRDLASGESRWRQALSFAPTWLGRHADRVSIGGSDAVFSLGLHDGATFWRFPAPSRFHAVFTFEKHQPKRLQLRDGFVGFRLGAHTLTVCDEQRRFFVFDLATGEIVAGHRAEASAIRPLDAGFFLPRWQGVGGTILAQSHAGKILWLDPQEPLAQSVTAGWPDDPLALNGLIYVPSSRGALQALDAGSRKVRWTFQASWPSTLTGEAIRTLGEGEALLAVVPRSLGHELLRLDPASGEVLWSLPAGQLREGLGTRCLDHDKLYHVVGGELIARSLATGAIAWKRDLRSANLWKLHCLPSALVLSPASAESKTDSVVMLLDPATGQLLAQIRLGPQRITSIGVQKQRLLVFAGGVLTCFAPQPGNNP